MKSAQADFALLKQRAGISQVPAPTSAEPVSPMPTAKRTPEDDLTRLQGRWRIVKRQPGVGPDNRLPQVEWTIEDDLLFWKVTRTRPGRTGWSSARPRDEDARQLLRPERQVVGSPESLYRLEGDTLENCSNGPDAPLPAEFKASDSGTEPFVSTFRRQADAPARTVAAKAGSQPPAAAKRPTDDDLARFQGRWRLVELRPDPGMAVKLQWTIEGDSLVSKVPGQDASSKSQLILGSVDGTKTLDITRDRKGKFDDPQVPLSLRERHLEDLMGFPDGPRPAKFGILRPSATILSFAECPSPPSSERRPARPIQTSRRTAAGSKT